MQSTILKQTMFRSTHSYFRSVSCPSITKSFRCTFHHCPYSHSSKNTTRGNNPTVKPPLKDIKNHQTTEKEKTNLASKVLLSNNKNASKPQVQAPNEKPDKPPNSNVKTVTTSPPHTNTKKRTIDFITPSSPNASSSPQVKKNDSQISLLPRPVAKGAPAPHPQRVNYVKLICKELETKNHPNPRSSAIEFEYNIAKDSSKSTYPAKIRNILLSIKKGEFSKEKKKDDQEKKDQKLKEVLNQKLKRFVATPSKLKWYGYPGNSFKPATIPPDLSVSCKRCSTQFRINEIDNSGKCVYHSEKIRYSETHYKCCGQAKGASSGCQTSLKHVYRLEDYDMMNAIIPFVQAPEKRGAKTLYAAAIDCEMGYTTLGYELIRATIVDWETGETVWDRTIYPMGDVIDLNTRFSGVKSLEDGITDPKSGKHYATISFKKARDEMFEYISQSTILIGHGLDNDLAVLRWMHNQIVDTAIVYSSSPHNRVSLKFLVDKYLNKNFQTGQHDSSEDARATIDVLKKNFGN